MALQTVFSCFRWCFIQKSRFKSTVLFVCECQLMCFTFDLDLVNECRLCCSFDLDPTQRLNIWSLVVGGLFSSITIFGIGQQSVQRYSALPTLKQAQRWLAVTSWLRCWVLSSVCELSKLAVVFKALEFWYFYINCTNLLVHQFCVSNQSTCACFCVLDQSTCACFCVSDQSTWTSLAWSSSTCSLPSSVWSCMRTMLSTSVTRLKHGTSGIRTRWEDFSVYWVLCGA